MVILEYRNPKGKKVTINMDQIAAIEELNKYTKIILTTGHEILVTEHASSITVDIEHAVKDREYKEWEMSSQF